MVTGLPRLPASPPVSSMGQAESGVFLFTALILTHCYSVLAILDKKGGYVEDEPRRNYRLEDFLWTGSGDGDGSGDKEATWATTTIFRTTTILTTIYPTPVFSHAESCSGSLECTISPTPTVAQPSQTLTVQPTVTPLPYPDVPDQRFWLVTVLETNDSNADLSPAVFEQRLANLYRTAFYRQQERHLKLDPGREKKTASRERRETVSVRVHRVRRDWREGSLQLIYTVRVSGRPVDPSAASQDISHVTDKEVADLLGFPVLTKAEPFLKTAETQTTDSRDLWLVVGGSVTAVVLVLVLLVLALLWLGKKKRKRSGSAKRRDSFAQRESHLGRENMSFQPDSHTSKDEGSGEEFRDHEDEPKQSSPKRKTSPPINYKPSTPNSYLSMPSIKAFPRGAAKPGPLEDVLESEINKSGVLLRHSSDTADPGVVGPLVWNLHCHRLNKKEEEESPNPDLSVGRIRRRFHELLDDAFSLFGSGSASPDEAESSSACNYGRAKSAVVLPVDPLSSDKILRPKTTEAMRPATAGVSRVPRGAWGPSSPQGTAPLRPLSAGPFHTPTLEPAWILSDSSLKPTDPAVPLIKAIKSELDKFPSTGSFQT